MSNDHSQWFVIESGVSDGVEMETRSLQAWAPATDRGRTWPVELRLDAVDGYFMVPLSNGDVQVRRAGATPQD